MSSEDLMTKIRKWDNRCSRWMMRHFYFLFFEFVLVVVFFIFFFNVFNVLDLSNHVSRDAVAERLLLQQTINSLIIVFLLLLNSFWMLYMFNGINRIRVLLKDITFSLTRRSFARKEPR